jgi:hypothetical protein
MVGMGLQVQDALLNVQTSWESLWEFLKESLWRNLVGEHRATNSR